MDVKNPLLFLPLLFICCQAHIFRMGGCPKVKVMKDFTMNEFLGDWYIIGRYNPLTTCVKLNINKTEDGTFTAEETSRPLGFSLSSLMYYNRRPKKLIIVKNDTDAIFKVSSQFRPFSSNTYGILDTDYGTQAIIWGCDPVLMGSVQNLDILSRNPDNADNMEILKKAKELAEKKGIDTQPLAKVEHANCPSKKKNGPNTVTSDAEDHGMEVK